MSGPGRPASGRVAALAVALLLFAGGMGVAGWRASGRLERLAEARIRKALEGAVAPGGWIEVALASRPPLRLLEGRIDRLRVRGSGLATGGPAADGFEIAGDDVRIDPVALARKGELAVRSARRLDVELAFDERTLNDYLRARYPLARLVTLRLLPSGPRLAVRAEAGGEALAI